MHKGETNWSLSTFIYVAQLSTIISKQGIARRGTTVEYTVLHKGLFLDLEAGGEGLRGGGGNALLCACMYAHMIHNMIWAIMTNDMYTVCYVV